MESYMSTPKKTNKKPTPKPVKRDDLLKTKAKKTSKKKPSKSKVKESSAKLAPLVERALDKFMTSTPPKVDAHPAFLRPSYENCCDDYAECVELDSPFQRIVKSMKRFVSSLMTAIKHSA